MKKRHLSFLITLLCQTASVLAVQGERQFQLLDNLILEAGQPVRARFRVTGQDQQPIEATIPFDRIQISYEQHINANLAQNLQNVRVFDPIQEGYCGHASKRVQATLRYQGREYPFNHAWDRQYPIQAEWNPHINPGANQIVADLALFVLDEDRRRVDLDHNLRPLNLAYNLVGEDPEQLAGLRYDGVRVYSIRTREQRWSHPQTGDVRPITATQFSAELPRHAGRTFVFAQPFVGNNDAMPAGGYAGRYQFDRFLENNEKYPQLSENSLIYSNGGHLYSPHITQELWRRDNTFIRILVASYREQDSLAFVPGTNIQGGLFDQGLYQLVSSEETPQERIERWALVRQDIRPGNQPEDVKIVRTLPGISSISGMGNFPLEWIKLYHDAGEVANLQRGMEQFHQWIHNGDWIRNSAGYRVGMPKVIFVGPSGSGKTGSIHTLGEISSDIILDQTGILRLQPQRLLPGFEGVGHQLVAGTTKPGFLVYNGMLIVDTQGVGDPGGAIKEILNAYSIDQVFSHQVKIVLTSEESSMIQPNRGANYIALIRKVVESFAGANNNNWFEGVSLLITKRMRPNFTPQALLRQMLTIPHGDIPDLDAPGVRDFIDYFSNVNRNGNQRVVSFPAPEYFRQFRPNDPQYRFLDQGEVYPEDANIHPGLDIRECINAAQFIHNPNFKLSIADPVKVYARDLADRMNNDIAHFIKTQGVQALINYCFNIVYQHAGDVTSLRACLNRIRDSLNPVSQIPADQALTFANSLNGVFGVQQGGNNQWLNTTFITEKIANIGFLKGLDNTINFRIPDWVNGFGPLVEQLTALTTLPNLDDFNPATHVLKLSGMLVGSSDINSAILLARPRGEIRTIKVHAFHGFFADANVESKETFLSLFSPFMRIQDQRIFTLSGLDKDDFDGVAALGTVGATGHTGGKGGGLIGTVNVVKYPERLTVNLRGGNGGKGQKGGKGSEGPSGANEEYPSVLEIQSECTGGPSPWSHKFMGVGKNCRFGKIKVRHGALVDAVEFIARAGRNEFVSLGRRGGGGGIETTIDLAPDEYMTGIRGEGGHDDLKKLYFITNVRTYGPYGTSGGPAFDNNQNREICNMQLFFNDQVSILKHIHLEHPHAVRRTRDRTLGTVGGQGARGGNGGDGGKAGILSVDGLEFAALNANSTREPGTGGAIGEGGDGGQGGLHGKLHSETADSRAANGTQGAQGASAGVSPQDAQLTDVQLNATKTEHLTEYARAFYEKARDRMTARFMRPFPGIPLPQEHGGAQGNQGQ